VKIFEEYLEIAVVFGVAVGEVQRMFVIACLSACFDGCLDLKIE
jgi:hypothetical protein